MEVFASSGVFLFEEFRFDRRARGVFRRDDSGLFTPVAIGSRGLDILGVLIEGAGEVVSKDEIIAAVWPGGQRQRACDGARSSGLKGENLGAVDIEASEGDGQSGNVR
jgi:hypothetical protein